MMATSQDFIEYVCEQINGGGIIRPKKMFGEYMIYVNEKPILLICDGIVYVKMRDEIAELMCSAETGFPYKGAKEHYILDIEDKPLTFAVIEILESITPLPKKRNKTQ